jgi:hypothetical protein
MAVLRSLIPSFVRSWPRFLIIGTMKGGTTSLYDYLCQHPQMLPARTKEVHYFDRYFDRGSGWYRQQFPVLSYRRRRWRAAGSLITGEATPSYLFHPPCPGRVAGLLPDVRLVVLLRNPVDRAYSHYHHSLRRGREPLPFDEAVDSEPRRLGMVENGTPHDSVKAEESHRWHSYLHRGHYAGQLTNWRQSFAESQFLIAESRELFQDRTRFLDRVTRFLGLADVDWTDLLKAFGASNEGSYPPLEDGLRRRLTDYFRPHNERLFELLGTRWDWNDA